MAERSAAALEFRVGAGREGVEQALLHELGVRPGEEWETLIAFPLCEGDEGSWSR